VSRTYQRDHNAGVDYVFAFCKLQCCCENWSPGECPDLARLARGQRPCLAAPQSQETVGSACDQVGASGCRIVDIRPAVKRRAIFRIACGDSFTYDAAGNMLSHASSVGDFRYQYDARNRLVVSYSGALATTELINGLGQRVARIGEDQPLYFAYDEAGHLIGQYSPNGVTTQETVWVSDLPVGVLQPIGQFYVAPDHLGAPHQITNAAGQAVWRWDHDPFGEGDPSGSFTYNLRFPGQFFDQRAKLNYNYFRDYDPKIGRYIESDPIGLKGGINTYSFAPITRWDELINMVYVWNTSVLLKS
jgi:RHS repeat-associated protein